MQSREQKGYDKKVICHFLFCLPDFCPTVLSRKSANYRGRKMPIYRGVKSIEKIDSVPTRCIAVESASKTYLAGKTMVPTHNTVFRRLSKWLPLSPEFKQAAFDIDDDLLADKFTKLANAMPKATIADLPTAQIVSLPDSTISVHKQNGETLTVDTATGEVIESNDDNSYDSLFSNDDDTDYSALED